MAQSGNWRRGAATLTSNSAGDGLPLPVVLGFLERVENE